MGATIEYKKRLQELESNVKFLMSMYLHADITPTIVQEAKEAGISGIKSYPAGMMDQPNLYQELFLILIGVTTNSSSGVVDYKEFFPVFAEMERKAPSKRIIWPRVLPS